MNILKRAYLYLRGKWVRSVLMLTIITLISTLMIASFAIKKTGKITQQNVASSIQSVLVTPKPNSFSEDSHGEGSLMKSEVDKVRNLPEVKGINVSQIGVTQLEGLKVLEPYKKTDFYKPEYSMNPYLTLMGNSNTKYDTRFISGMLQLTQGKHIDEQSKNEVLVHEKFAELNNLKLGDTLSLSKDPVHYKGNDFSKVEATIVGFFKGTTHSQAVYPEEMVENSFLADETLLKKVYGYSEDNVKYYQTNFYLNDDADINKFVEKLKETDIDFTYFDIIKKDPSLDTYNRSLKILNNTINVLYVGILSVSAVTLVLSMFFWIQSKMKETGILLAVGKTKVNIIMEYMIEMAIIAVLGLALSFAVGNKAGNMLGNGLIDASSSQARKEVKSQLQGGQLGADAYTDMTLQTVKRIEVEISKEEYVLFYSIISGLILVSVTLATVSIVRLKTKEILTKLS